MRGFININYEEGDASTYESVTLKVAKTGGFGEEVVHTFATDNPVKDFLDAHRKGRELDLDYILYSSDVDHFVTDSDYLEWKVWPDGSERFVYKDNYSWGYTYYHFTGWRKLLKHGGERRYKIKWMRIQSPKRTDSLYTTVSISFLSRTPTLAARWMARQLQEGRVDKPEDFEGQTINVTRKGERIETT